MNVLMEFCNNNNIDVIVNDELVRNGDLNLMGDKVTIELPVDHHHHNDGPLSREFGYIIYQTLNTFDLLDDALTDWDMDNFDFLCYVLGITAKQYLQGDIPPCEMDDMARAVKSALGILFINNISVSHEFGEPRVYYPLAYPSYTDGVDAWVEYCEGEGLP